MGKKNFLDDAEITELLIPLYYSFSWFLIIVIKNKKTLLLFICSYKAQINIF